jgi:hypothetical protein
MRAVVKILFVTAVTFFTTMMLLRMFFSDVKPIAWSDAVQSSTRLQLAFFLLTVENIAALGSAIALIALFTLWARSYRAGFPERGKCAPISEK